MDGMLVNVELMEYAERGSAPIGRVIEILAIPTISESMSRS